MRRLFSGLLAVLLLAALAGSCAAADAVAQSTLDEQMEAFRAEYGLNEENFAISYYNTATGESYSWNDTHFMVAASTFKLPLNLYYYELENDGKMRSDTRIAGTTLADCHYQSLVWSNNDLSIAMLYRLGSFRTYKKLMRKYFTIDDSLIDPIYYQDNYYCTSMMLDCLKYLYDRSEEFPEMLEYLKEAEPDAYFKRDVCEYAIAHKYGYFEGAVNDVGIVYTSQPFLLAVYTTGVGEDAVAGACRLLTSYTAGRYDETLLACMVPDEEDAPVRADPAGESESSPTGAQTTASAPANAGTDAVYTGPAAPDQTEAPEECSPWIFVLIAASVLLAADCAVLVFLWKRR